MLIKTLLNDKIIDPTQHIAMKLILSKFSVCQCMPTPQIDAIVDNDVDCGTCIILATKRLIVAENKMIRTAFVLIISEGTMPLLNVLETSLPKKTAPKIVAIKKTIPALRLVNALLPTAVENELAKLGAPIFIEKNTAIIKTSITVILYTSVFWSNDVHA